MHCQVQAQRDVGVFRRVLGGAADFNLVEADLAGTLAAYFFVSDGLVVQVAQRQAVHIVGAVRFEHIRLQQRIVHDAAQTPTRLGSQRHDVSAMADGDEAIGEDALALALHEPFEIGHEPPPSLESVRKDLPHGLAQVVMKCLEKNRDDRYRSVHELAKSLAAYGKPESPQAVTRIAGMLQRKRPPTPPPLMSEVTLAVRRA